MSKPKRQITFGYIFFYLLFSADTWRVLCGVVMAVVLTPHLATGREMSPAGQGLLGLMLVAIGWWVTAWPMEKWAAFLRRRMRSISW
jgi:dipeptide/tripeptide permease